MRTLLIMARPLVTENAVLVGGEPIVIRVDPKCAACVNEQILYARLPAVSELVTSKQRFNTLQGRGGGNGGGSRRATGTIPPGGPEWKRKHEQ